MTDKLAREETPTYIKRIADTLRSWVPDGDGYNSQYAHDLEAAARLIELLAAQRKYQRARHKSYKRRFRELEAAIADAPEVRVISGVCPEDDTEAGEILDLVSASYIGKTVRLVSRMTTTATDSDRDG